MTEKTIQSKKLRGVLIPLVLSIIIGGLIFYGGDAYQAIGLAGLGTAHLVFGYVLGISGFLVVAVLLQRLAQYVLLDWLVASAIGSQPPRLLGQLAAFFIYLIAFTAIVGVVFKKDLTFVLAASGAAGIVIGMALQNLILDIFAGLALNLDRIVKIGDNIQLHRIGDQTIEGKVTEISWRTMQLFDLSQNIVIIPNRLVSASTITNFSSPQPFLETGIPIILDSKIPVDRAMRILRAATTEALLSLALPAELSAPTVSVSEILHIPRLAVKYTVFITVPFEKRARSRNLVQQHILRHLNFAGVRPAQREFPETSYLATLITMTELFYGIKEAGALLIATHARLKRITANTVITQRGEIAEVMFLVIEGLLIAETRHKIGTKPLPPTILGPGGLIGGTTMLMNDVYDSTVLSKTDCLLVEMNHGLWEQLFTQYPELTHLISKNIARQITTKDTTSGNQWQMTEADMMLEVLRNLKRRFIQLKLD